TAICLYVLAACYLEQSKYELAEPLLQRSLAIREKVQDTDSASIARTLESLADIYDRQGKNELADSFYQRSIAAHEKDCENAFGSAMGNASRNAFETILCYTGGREKAPVWTRSIHQARGSGPAGSSPADERQRGTEGGQGCPFQLHRLRSPSVLTQRARATPACPADSSSSPAWAGCSWWP